MPNNTTFNYLTFTPKTPPHNIVFLLHGYGSDMYDLKPIVTEFLQHQLPNTVFIILNAPFTCDLGQGYQWFPLVFTENDVTIRDTLGLNHINTLLTTQLNDIITKYQFTKQQTYLFGFSQGGILTLYHSLYHHENYGGIICHSGCFYGDSRLNINNHQRILLIHGKQDQVITFTKFQATQDFFYQHNITYKSYIDDNLAHNCSDETLKTTCNFILQSMNQR